MKRICCFLCSLLLAAGMYAEEASDMEKIIDSGRWIVHFGQMTEDRLNNQAYREMNQELNFLCVKGDSLTLQYTVNGAQKVESLTPQKRKKSEVAFSKYDNGMGGETRTWKILDMKKTLTRKGVLKVTIKLDNMRKATVDIWPDNEKTNIYIQKIARMIGTGVTAL